MPLQDMTNRLNANINVRTHLVTTIESGMETGFDTRRVRIAANSTTAQLQSRPANSPPMTPWIDIFGATVTQAQMINFVSFIQNNSFLEGQHRNVLNNLVWRAFYHVAARALTYIDHNNAPVVIPAEDSVACFDCNILLPVRNIAIDHQRPQVGNSTEPVCKVFRALGLTQSAPTGPKGTHFMGVHRAGVGGVIGTLNTAGGSVGKYTLNNIGQIYFTIADWCSLVDNSELDKLCMNHVINLRPLCNNCNTPNRNVRYF